MNSNKLTYPVARRDEKISDDFHGILVKDPYRWMEDSKSEETKSYVQQLNKVSSRYLEEYPYRDLIKQRLNEIEDYEKVGVYSKEGGRYFYKMNTGLQNQSVLYMTEDWRIPGKPFLDPNALAPDGTVANRLLSFSRDGSILAFGMSENGSDVINVQFKMVESGQILEDTLNNLLYTSVAWEPQGRGVFYTMYPDDRSVPADSFANKGEYHSVYYHALGTPQRNDILCFDVPEDPDALIEVEVSEDDELLICTVTKGCASKNRVFYGRLSQCRDAPGSVRVMPLFNELDGKYEFCGVYKKKLLFVVTVDSPKGRLVLVNAAQPTKENFKILLPEEKSLVLKWAKIINTGYLFVCYLRGTHHIVQVFQMESMTFLACLLLPQCTVVGFTGKSYDSEVFLKYTSFLNAGVILHYDANKPKFFWSTTEVHRSESVQIPPSEFEVTHQVCTSFDGTEIPLTIIESSKAASNDTRQTAPAILYGYGGFGISMLPNFNTLRLAFVKGFEGVFAVANIRGGGEFGSKWHDDGKLGKKQNVFCDFLAAARCLCNKGYTCPEKLCIMGGSNGGLLVAACANQYPDMFRCVISQVGLFDMLRFNKFTIGQAWTTEYGDPQNPADFANLIQYSPLHNVRPPKKDKQIPATLLLTAENDDRVVPCHSLKYVAEIYHCIEGCAHQTNPVLAKIDSKTGHSIGKPVNKHVEENVDILCFVGRVLNLNWEF
ncbi:hypothetical protein M514_09568 [Trichuris suis]|uniref:Prolyl endopeptidase n=1 Tax=Trichuris suis TaxID=68888 RepID=A0A085NLF4_9BILA|nr:hypothetical protein M514_09568 [Trichuris suis]